MGSLTGFGEFVGIGEKVRKQNPVKQNETRLGKPWTYALRDLLQFSKTIGEGLSGLNKTKRTCSIYAGVSSAQSNTFRLIEYSFKEFKVYDDNNFPYTATHLQMDNVVFMPIHDDSDSCFNDLLHKQYGKITDEWIMNTLAPMHKTGDTQLAVFNFKTQQLLLQVSLDKKLSFDRPALRINLKGMFQSRYT